MEEQIQIFDSFNSDFDRTLHGRIIRNDEEGFPDVFWRNEVCDCSSKFKSSWQHDDAKNEEVCDFWDTKNVRMIVNHFVVDL